MAMWTKSVASTKRTVLDVSLFKNADPKLWEQMYQVNMEQKYHKNARRFNSIITGSPVDDPQIYVVPRIRGGPGYKSVELRGTDRSKVQYCPISKGFPMQETSSFSLGPVVGEGLCLVNAAFSKTICIAHLEGGGFVNLKRKCFWQRSRKPPRQVLFEGTSLIVDGIKHNVYEWLTKNENLWYDEWYKWCCSIALCSRGDFHWSRGLGLRVAFHNSFTTFRQTDGSSKSAKPKYIDFVTWKKECYIKPSYELTPRTSVYAFLYKLRTNKIPIGLVHPMGYKGEAKEPISRSMLRELFDSDTVMSCQPYAVAGLLLGVPLYQ